MRAEERTGTFGGAPPSERRAFCVKASVAEERARRRHWHLIRMSNARSEGTQEEAEMHRRLCVFVLGILYVAILAGWCKPDASAGSDQYGKTDAGKTRPQKTLPTQPTGDAQQLRRQVETATAKAAGKGEFACCIQPTCSWCMLQIGKCTCALGVGSGRWACRECHGGWEAGQGRIPGKSRDDVRKMKILGVDKKSQISEPIEETPVKATTTSPPGKASNTGAPP